jgi:hypothetical protein
MQCVVLADNSAEGGVQARFLAQLNKGQVTEDYVECENYKVGNANHKANGVFDGNTTLPLNTAPFLFTWLDSTDDEDVGMHAMQINQDVLDTISYVIDQLQVSEIPDLLCAFAPDWNVTLTDDNIRHMEISRYGVTGYDELTKQVGGLSKQLDLVANVSIHNQVLKFLTRESGYEWDVDNHLVTVDTLIQHKVIRRALELQM